MSEQRTTLALGGIALALLLITVATAPRVGTPSLFAERGQDLFPAFRDPNAAASLEVTGFDARTGAVRPFKVQNRGGRWTIPSQHDYPADAADRLSQIAAALIALKKDDVVSDNAADEERCGVVDPLDAPASGASGRGTRVLVRGAHDEVLADVVLGNPVEGHPGFRYVRQPDQRRIYSSNVGDLKLSTDFGDWIDRDLLRVDPLDINAVNLRTYSVDGSNGRINPGETLLLEKTGDRWRLQGSAGAELNVDAMDALLRNLVTLRIAGVLPKPQGLTAMLSAETGRAAIGPEERGDLARKGFYLASDGQLLSNQGEIVVRTTHGVFYTLRFGDIAQQAESRYLFIMVNFDPRSAGSPELAAEGSKRTASLRERFAPWYYVMTGEEFAKLRPKRSEIVKAGP
jgi:hypothetical protein